MAADIGWELYRSFLGVVNEGSLSGAARALGITQPTVGRHVAALEEALGLALFTRSQTGLLPTRAALALRPYAETMRSTADALRRVAASQGEGITGTVRVSASEVVGIEVLPPIIAQLTQAHPDLTVELTSTNRMQDVLMREADIAVRMAPPRQGSLIARRVGVISVGLFAHQRYLARRGMPQTISELVQHTLIGFDEETPFIRDARKVLPAWHREAFSVRTDSDVGQLSLIRAGCGIGVCQIALARGNPDLVRVLPLELEFPMETWVTMHEDLRTSSSCRATFEALVRGLTEYLD